MIQEKACSVKKKEVSEMLKRINDVLAGLPMTIIGGVLLVFSFVLPRVDVSLPIDPAWGTVVISGIPLLYLAVWRIIYNPGICPSDYHCHVCRHCHWRPVRRR